MHPKKVLIGIHQNVLTNKHDDYARQGLCALTQVKDAKIAIIGGIQNKGLLEKLPVEAKVVNNSSLSSSKLLEKIAQEEFNSPLSGCGRVYVIGNNARQTRYARKLPNAVAIIVNDDEAKYKLLVKTASDNGNNGIIPAPSFFVAAIKLVCNYERA
ncbi:MAG: hypothetical protein QXM31_01480 [Candidatus Woesearchaeota archaeon]